MLRLSSEAHHSNTGYRPVLGYGPFSGRSCVAVLRSEAIRQTARVHRTCRVPFPLLDKLPEALRGVILDLHWDLGRLRALRLPERVLPVADLAWAVVTAADAGTARESHHDGVVLVAVPVGW